VTGWLFGIYRGQVRVWAHLQHGRQELLCQGRQLVLGQEHGDARRICLRQQLPVHLREVGHGVGHERLLPRQRLKDQHACAPKVRLLIVLRQLLLRHAVVQHLRTRQTPVGQAGT